MSQILIIEDEGTIRSALRRLLRRHGYAVEEVGSVAEATHQFDLTGFGLIIADLRLPDAPGTDVIPLCGDTPVLIMTSDTSVDSAVRSMKAGATDYITKPFNHDEMVLVVERLLKQTRIQRQNAALRFDMQREYPVQGMVGNCAAMREVFDRIGKVAPTETTVLIVGESGTGKELVARAIHDKSERRDAPIITVNCGAIPDILIESELFGHERGAFTGAMSQRTGLVEVADGGTVFLDEVAGLSPSAQAGLLQVLQYGEVRRVGASQAHHVDVRVLAATHCDLDERVQDGRFREDLYLRLQVMEIRLPALRDRGEDIRELSEYLLGRLCERLNRPKLALSAATHRVIGTYRWPGNIHELENAIERAVIRSHGRAIVPELLAIDTASHFANSVGASLTGSLDDYFREYVRAYEGTVTETELARRLGISRKTLWDKRQRLGVPRQRPA